MTEISRSALLPYSQRCIYALVNDVAAYPEFMAGCSSATVLSENEHHMQARLDLSQVGVSINFTTENILTPHESIQLRLVDGPFDQFEGTWAFVRLAETACKVTLDLRFQLSGAVASAAAGTLINSVANNLVDAMCKRAKQVYG